MIKPINPMIELNDLPADLWAAIAKHPTLTNEDQALFARTCRKARLAVEFCNVSFRRWYSTPPPLAQALAGCRTQTLNVCSANDGLQAVHIDLLSAVGHVFPDRVARLRHVRVCAPGRWLFGDALELPRAVFSALETIAITSEVANPMNPMDARYMYEFVTIDSNHAMRLEILNDVMGDRQCRRLDVVLSEDCVDLGPPGRLRVGRLNVHSARPELAPTLCAMATQGLGVFADPSGRFSAAAVRVFRADSVRALTVRLGSPGMLVDLDARYAGQGPGPALWLTLSSPFPIPQQQPENLSDEDELALVRLMGRGVLASLKMEHARLPPEQMQRLSMRLLDAMPVSVKQFGVRIWLSGALDLSARPMPIESLTLLLMDDESATDAGLAQLGQRLRAWDRLVTLEVAGCRRPASRLTHLVDALVAEPVPSRLESVCVPGLSWSRTN